MAGKKGQIPWNKGIKGKQPWHNISGFKKNGGWNKGIAHSQQHKEKISIGIKNSKKYKEAIKNPERSLKISRANKGKLLTEETKKRIGLSGIGLHVGNKNGKWIEDRTKLKKYIGNEERRSSIYKYWRKQVCLRDNFKCKIGNADCQGRLEVHHILGYTEHPELRYDINNGITLCKAHHPKMRAEEKRLIPTFQELVSVSKVLIWQHEQ